MNQERTYKRKGVVAVATVVLIAVMLGFAALTIDVGVAYNVKADLQDSVDAAALAAASAYVSDQMMQVRMGNDDSFSSVLINGQSNADEFAWNNPTMGLSGTHLASADVDFGWLDLASASSTVDGSGLSINFNSVQVTARRDDGGPNGAVAALFSRVFGNTQFEIGATATASFDDRVAGVDTNFLNGALPFTINETMYNTYFNTGPDAYQYDADMDSVGTGADGVREVNLYPQNLGPGNFGLLNIGTPNQGVPALRAHIEDGVPPEDFEAETGSDVLIFNDDGTPASYTISGNPGMKTALESSVDTKVGQVVAYFLHDGATGSGANLDYNITKIVFGRVMSVQLNGPPSSRGIWIQPATYTGGGIITSPSAPSSDGTSGLLVISR